MNGNVKYCSYNKVCDNPNNPNYKGEENET